MGKNLLWRSILILALVLVAIVYLVPTAVGDLPDLWKKVLPTDKLRLGLDLKGGMHLILGVQMDKAVESSTQRTAEQLRGEFRRRRLRIASIERQDLTDIVIKMAADSDVAAVKKELEQYPVYEMISDTKEEIVLRLRSAEANRIRQYAVEQGKETIRNRVDQFGVAETTIVKQGEDRILVELPGIKDPKRAIELIGKTALLEFKLLDEEHSVESAQQGNIPPGSVILNETDTDPVTGRTLKTPYLVKNQALVTGDLLTDAKVEIDSQTNNPYVSIEFSSTGARIFSEVTGENVGKKLAIILDNNVYSAPVIQEKIPDGRARITGRFTMEEARDLAIVLRAGALPAPVEILENRTVGPSLGSDLVRKGIISIVIGTLAVLAFMGVYYKLSGMVANLALVLNLLFTLAVLAGFKAALTLPGIAGLVLSLGMAVDANVLIFERTREEMRLGRGVYAAIDSGYGKAMSSIWDANLTTLIAAVILWAAGTGPIRGFAVTLSIGIITSMFTAIVVTRVVFDFFVLKRKAASLSI